MNTITLETLKAALALMPKGPFYHAVVTQPQYADKLRAHLPFNDGPPMFPAVQVYAKVDQLANGWMFSDDRLLRDYLAGKVSEWDLLAHGGVKPVGGN